LTSFVNAILSPFRLALPTPPPGESPFAWALLAFVRRNFFNQSPDVTTVTVGQQSTTGVIRGRIGGIDPDELGKTIQIRANVYAGAPTPTGPGTPASDPNLILVGAYTNPAVLGTAQGDNWHAPAAVDNTVVYVNAADNYAVVYTGTETGQVTIDGLGTGGVHLEFTGNLFDGDKQEQSFATLRPDLGTGDLKGVTGTVHSVSTLNADGTANGVLTGTVQRPELRYVVVRGPGHGTVSVDEVTGAFTYTPDAGYAEQGGEDSFQVLVTDHRANLLQVFQPFNGDPVQTVTLTVAPVTTLV
jgi:hypothetical protein